MSFPLVLREQYDEVVAQLAILRAQSDGQGSTISREKYDDALRQISDLQAEGTRNLERIVALAGENLDLKHTVEELRGDLAGRNPASANRRPNLSKVLEIAARTRAEKKATG